MTDQPESKKDNEDEVKDVSTTAEVASQQAYSGFHSEVYADREQGRSGGGLFIRDLDARRDSNKDLMEPHPNGQTKDGKDPGPIDTTTANGIGEGGTPPKDYPDGNKTKAGEPDDLTTTQACIQSEGGCGAKDVEPFLPTTTREGGLEEKPPTTTREGGLEEKPPTTMREGGLEGKPPTTTREGGLEEKPPTTTREGGIDAKPCLPPVSKMVGECGTDSKPITTYRESGAEVKPELPPTDSVAPWPNQEISFQKPNLITEELSTGDVLIKEDGKEMLITPNGDSISVNPDGSHTIKGDVSKVVTGKDGGTTVTMKDGSVISFDRDGILSVQRGNQGIAFSRPADPHCKENRWGINPPGPPPIGTPPKIYPPDRPRDSGKN